MSYNRGYCTRVFITNSEVAWEIPKEPGIAFMYDYGYYSPPDGWTVMRGLKGQWKQNGFGIYRRVVKVAKAKK